MSSDLPTEPPLDSSTAQPVNYERESLNALTPMGQVESLGSFARGLGPRRVRIAIGIFAVGVLVLTVFSSVP